MSPDCADVSSTSSARNSTDIASLAMPTARSLQLKAYCNIIFLIRVLFPTLLQLYAEAVIRDYATAIFPALRPALVRDTMPHCIYGLAGLRFLQRQTKVQPIEVCFCNKREAARSTFEVSRSRVLVNGSNPRNGLLLRNFARAAATVRVTLVSHRHKYAKCIEKCFF